MSDFSLSLTEKQVLFKKYISMNYSYEEADKKIKDFCQFLHELKEKLKKKKMPEEDINLRFKREFEKLVQRLESGEEYKARLSTNSKRKSSIFKDENAYTDERGVSTRWKK